MVAGAITVSMLSASRVTRIGREGVAGGVTTIHESYARVVE
jgi:hypothetical protein